MSQLIQFQTASGGAILTVTGDSGGPLLPAGGNINILGGLNIVTSGAGNTLTIAETQAVLANNYHVVNFAMPYVVQPNDYYITVDTSTFATQINLPDAPTQFQMFIIKDSAGNASVRNITVTTVSGIKSIDANPIFTMNKNWQSIGVLYDGFGYQIFIGIGV